MQVNRINSINRMNSINFKAKLPHDAVIAVATGHLENQNALNSVREVCSTMKGGHGIRLNDLPATIAECSEALKRQFPILEEIAESSKNFFNGTERKPDEINNWLSQQIQTLKLKHAELDVNPIIDDGGRNNPFNIAA